MGFFLKASKRGSRGTQKRPKRVYDMANQHYAAQRERLGLPYKPNRRSQNNPFYLVPIELQRIVNAVQSGQKFEEPARAILVFWESRRLAEERLRNFPKAFMTDAHLTNYEFFVELSKRPVIAYFLSQAYGAEKLLESLKKLQETEGLKLPDELLSEIIIVATTAQALVESNQ